MNKLTQWCAWCALLALLGALLASPALAQTSGSATLRGTITDPSGAVVPSAKVLLRDDQTQQERTATTNEEGGFTFTALTPGSFTVKIERVGFKAYTQNKLTLSPSETRGLNITLEIGAATESVTVTGRQHRFKPRRAKRLTPSRRRRSKTFR